jgi:hypothetical protein
LSCGPSFQKAHPADEATIAERKDAAAKELLQEEKGCVNNAVRPTSAEASLLLGVLGGRLPPSATWPRVLKTGDSLKFDAVSCGDQVVNVTIFTDRGQSTYKFP